MSSARKCSPAHLVGAQPPQLLGRGVPGAARAAPRRATTTPSPRLAEDRLEEGVEPVELAAALAQLVVDRLELLVGRLELLVHRLELLVGRLELLVGRLELLVGRLELLVGRLELLDRRLQLLVGGLELALGAARARPAARRASVTSTKVTLAPSERRRRRRSGRDAGSSSVARLAGDAPLRPSPRLDRAGAPRAPASMRDAQLDRPVGDLEVLQRPAEVARARGRTVARAARWPAPACRSRSTTICATGPTSKRRRAGRAASLGPAAGARSARRPRRQPLARARPAAPCGRPGA